MLNVSTKKGDKGKTYLASGVRLSKSNPVFEVLGCIDELNSYLGLTIVLGQKFPNQEAAKEVAKVQNIQELLFTASGVIAGSKKVSFPFSNLKKLETQAERLQSEMSKSWTNKFLYSGGTELAAHLDIARTVCRKVERRLVAWTEVLSTESPKNSTESRKTKLRKSSTELQNKDLKTILKYFNRLSDYLFVLRVFVNYSALIEDKAFISKN